MARRSNKPSADEFLAAPDSVRKSESERTKYLARKARDEAEKRQLLASKAKDLPSDEDLLADVVRVAEDEDTNPHAKFRSVSRRRYELYGHYPISFVDERYGQFDHFKQVAGLEDKPGTRAKKAARAQASRAEHAQRYAERYILPHVRKHPDLERELVGTKLVLSISDTHATFLDPFTWYVFLSTCRDLKPDVVVLNGDILEGSEISRHPKIPGWTIPLQLEFDFAQEMFRQVRAAVGKGCRIVWTAGNHGLDRIAAYLTQVAPALANLRTLRFDKLVDLAGLDIELAQGGTIASPLGTENQHPGILLWDKYHVHHGTKLGDNPAMTELRVSGRSGQSGHVHRPGLVYATTAAQSGLTWMSTPMGCQHIAGRAYMKGPTTGWCMGFGVAFVHQGGRVHHYPVVTEGDVAIVEGYAYERHECIIEPDPSKLWLTDFEVPS